MKRNSGIKIRVCDKSITIFIHLPVPTCSQAQSHRGQLESNDEMKKKNRKTFLSKRIYKNIDSLLNFNGILYMYIYTVYIDSLLD